MGLLNQDGRCKVFDEDVNGYIRIEGVSVAFLQKAKTAKRIYATIIHAKTNCDGYKEEGITFPSNKMQSTKVLNNGLPADDDLPRLVTVSGHTAKAVILICQAIMKIPIFAKSIEKYNAILKSHKLNIYEILTEKGKNMLDNILYLSVGIATVQVISVHIQLLKRFETGPLGFINCLQKKHGGNIFRTVSIQDLKAPKFSLKIPFYSEQLETDLVTNVLRPGNIWRSYRHQLLPPRDPKLSYHAIINQGVRGDLSTIRWIEGCITKDYQNENLVSIHYASLNFKDMLLSTGKIAPEEGSRKDVDCVIGYEYSGKSISGHRIMGVNCNSMEHAATVPFVYCTCIAAPYINGEMQKGDKILIHAGFGGIG
ncbi:hypothetical protein HZH68_003948 [Vespula germanica]|uniref:Fatty acid synthase pseudo-KR domain-containing protein n=1 Tax=Vespula germanica TaxID=30212 RepID=A0A834KMZ4_VESGE|nr:hypothetical protein HZH68_003948 [Vespula germanica]